MAKEEELLEQWRELPPDKQQQVLEFVHQLKSSSEKLPPSDFVPKTPLSQKLWQIRQRAIASGLKLLNEEEIEREVAARRGGLGES
jgi:mRNA-degrading endonuclease RelE of RelBE toxin-antitoxin system